MESLLRISGSELGWAGGLGSAFCGARGAAGLALGGGFGADFTGYLGTVENPGCHPTSLRRAVN